LPGTGDERGIEGHGVSDAEHWSWYDETEHAQEVQTCSEPAQFAYGQPRDGHTQEPRDRHRNDGEQGCGLYGFQAAAEQHIVEVAEGEFIVHAEDLDEATTMIVAYIRTMNAAIATAGVSNAMRELGRGRYGFGLKVFR